MRGAFLMSKKVFLFLLLLIVAALVGGLAQTARAQQPTPSDNDVNRVARQLYCPVCENVPLDVCPTTACQEWRELIRLKLSEGWSDEQIKEYFAMQYGDRVLAEPPRRGLNWLIYVLPPVAILAGAVLVVRILRRMQAKPAPAEAIPSVPLAPEEEYLKRVEEELKRAEKSGR
jgi:cytochrome c-type biogenesis protein CcmH